VTKENYITVLDFFAKISDISNSCEGTHGEVSFTQTSRNAVSLTWDFGDGSTLVTGPDQLTVKHIYKQTGSYNVTLTASNGQCSQTDYNKAYVLLKQKPVFTASAKEVCPNEQIQIDVSGLAYNPQPFPYSNPYNIILRYADGTVFDGSASGNWNYGGNEYSGSIYNFNRSDETVQAIAISSYFNCNDTSNFVTVKIKGAGATAKFEVADNSCYSSPVEFKDISGTTPGVPIQSWLWDFGDGQTTASGTGGTVSHTYKSPGIYYASLRITDAGGCSSATPSYAQQVSVPGPLAAFSTSGINVPLNSSIYFYNNTNNNGSPGTVYSWDFGDQSAISDEFSPVHTYPVAGTYTVTLTATNPATSCSSRAQQVIVVKNFNTAFGFTTSYIAGSCPPVLVSFYNTSVNYTRVTWDFGDGITADNLSYASHVYEKPGKYIVTLHVYAPNGISADYIDSVFVRAPSATATVSPLEVCIGSPVSLIAKADNTSAYIWDYGDGNIGTTTAGSASHQYLSSGNFQTELMLQDDKGCYGKAEPASPVTVRANPVISLSPENPLVCLGSSIALHASGGTNYLWTPATGLSNDKSADPLASPVVNSSYSIRVTDDFGCTNTRTVAVEVIQPLSLQVNSDTAVCAGNPVPMKATGEEIYEWIGTTEGLSNPTVPDPIALPPTSMIYTVRGSDKHNCFSQTASVHIRVMPLPLVSAGADAEIWSGEATQLNGTGSNDVIQWDWQPEKYLSCYDCPSPVCTPQAETSYILTAKNQDGCLARDTMFVKIDCAASHVFIPNIFTPNRDGINDLFMIQGISIIKHMVIYGRWGEKVFERSNFIAGDRASCWNGTFKGLDAPAGSYVYFIEMECPAGGLFTRRGSVVLVR
jgi:gliding motility-associated-like protein